MGTIYNDTSDMGNSSVVFATFNDPTTTTTDIYSNTTLGVCDDILQKSSGPPPEYSVPVRYVISGILFLFPCMTMLGNAMVIVAVLTHKRLKSVTPTRVFMFSDSCPRSY